MKTEDIERIAVSILGHNGAMISGSKSGYARTHPDNLYVFNSGICTLPEEIWHGDIDITLSSEKIIELSEKLNKTLYVLRESDCWDGLRIKNHVARVVDGELVLP